MGRHLTGFPGPTLRKVIHSHSIVKQFVDHGKKAALLNAYSQAYLERILKKPRFMSASTHVHRASGQALKTLDDLEEGNALYMDITHEVMHSFFPELADRFAIQDAGARGRDLVEIARRYDLVIHEFFISDKAGHKMNWETARWCIETLESFWAGIISAMDTEKELLIVASDHGNMEDLSTRTHTNNPVPTFLYGCGAEEMSGKIKSLADIPRAIYESVGLQTALESVRAVDAAQN